MKLFSAALAVSLLAMPAMAQDAGSRFSPDQAVQVSGVSANSSLNVRQGPGTSYPVVATLAAGRAGLTIVECSSVVSWCRVGAASGPLGWVSSRYLVEHGVATAAAVLAEARFSESARLTAVTGIALNRGGMTTVSSLPPYLLGAWDVDATACADVASKTLVTVQENGLQVGVATARFKNAVFRDDGYDLTTLLMKEQDVPNAVPQRALYRLEPDVDTLAISGDVLEVRRLRRCDG